MTKQTLAILPETFTIYSLHTQSAIPPSVLSSPIFFIGKTYDELSLVVPEPVYIEAEESDPDWRALEVLGPLELSMVGIMAQIGNVLAQAKVSIFVVSTFETDYFLVKQQDLDAAQQALQQAGYKVMD
ncbi:hypothetical protein HMF8227_01643 [Saliniradius amylolyticus]|uniref:CASTOR ACT domain-containing protein n=1 Tax=Saliniradius amylolyticus TaxID=2183582 RepID=A0A2S2E382_9ALTE|nr:ACT domain-containing protein [Saliniradius amylolyticus]AWL12116.1 hypothetical protein HMF8227_01643 [Saliniradius amylolyticus]